MTPFEKSIKFWLIICVVLLGLIAGKIYYPAEKINSLYEEYRYNKDIEREIQTYLELSEARQYKVYDNTDFYISEENKMLLELADLVRDQRNGIINDYEYASQSTELLLRYYAIQ